MIKRPAEVSLINYDEAMQIEPAAGSPACTVQLARRCAGGRLILGLGEQLIRLLLKYILVSHAAL